MRKDFTELVFILDRSGSMAGLESDTIGGFNGMLEKQKKVPGEATVTTVLFDDRYELLYDSIPLDQALPMTEEQYYVRGCTALLDAVGRTIQDTEGKRRRQPEEERAEKVLVVITTDGLENASQEYTYDKLKKLIEMKKTEGWDFVFLGANMDAVKEGARFGIHADRSVTYSNSSRGVRENYKAVSNFMEASRTCAAPVDASWKRSVEEVLEEELQEAKEAAAKGKTGERKKRGERKKAETKIFRD